MSTINTTKYNGIELGTSYASPLTITSPGFINAGTNGYNGAAVYAAAAQSLALYNDGRIFAAGTVEGVHEGVDLGLTVNNTGTITAAANGITLQQAGPVTNSGTIISSGGVAIRGNTGLQVTNAIGGLVSGGSVGIKAASATITNYGTVQGTATSSTAVYLNGGGDNGTVSNYGLLSATYYGVHFRDSGTLSNVGTITSTGRYGVRFDGTTASVTNSGTIAGSNALKVLGDGIVSNTGRIVGLNAVAISGTASLANAGTIDATDGTGVSLGSGGTISNAAAGIITATSYAGVNVGGGAGTITNAGTISGYTGIAFNTADVANQTVVDSGTIIGSGGAAIVFGAGDDLLQLQPGNLLIQGNVDGGGGGNTLEFASAASTGTLNGVGANFVNFTAGTIDAGASWLLTGSNVFGGGFTLTDSGTLTVAGTLTNQGSIAVDPPLIVTGTLINSDTISAPGTYTAVSIVSGGVVSNTASGVIVGGNDAITASGTVSISNLGSITGTTISGIALVAGYVVNGATDNTAALIAGRTSGVSASGTATVVNYAMITASGTAGLGVTIANGSVINGASGDTAALISGTAYGVRVASGQISNYGTLSGNVGARFNTTGSLTNHAGAQIAGTSVGFNANGASDTVSNLGTIRATSGNGVVASGDSDVIINGTSGATSGLISAGARGVVLQANGGNTLFNYGTITGAIGLYDNGAGGTLRATVVNAGTIIGTGGTAISAGALGSSNLLLRFVPGNSFIQGTVSGERGGTGVLDFASGATTGTLTGSNADFINFQTASVDAGASWVFAGTNTLGSSVALVDAGTLTNTGSLVVDPPITVTGTFINSSIVSAPGTYTAFYIANGGVLSNTASGVITGGNDAITASGTVSVSNLGSITGTTLNGIALVSGTIVNGATDNTAALIAGAISGVTASGTAAVFNYATITASGGGAYGVALANGSVTNGSRTYTAALISGTSYGVRVGTGLISNYGTITGAIGIFDNATLGSLYATVVNAGTVIGTGGTAISSGSVGGSNLLLRFVPGNSYIQGTVSGENGGTGVLQFASGATAGTLTGSNADFINFQTASVDAGANWVFAGTNTIDSGVPLVNAGTLTTYDTLTLVGSLTNGGTLINAGTILVADYTALQLAPGSYLRNDANSVIDRIPGGATTFPDPTILGLAGGASTIANLGTITNTYATGIYLQGGGTIVNGAAGTTVSSATIYGLYYGVLAANNPATVTNYGVIASGTCGCGTYDGVHLSAGGSVTNAQFATISGYLAGVFMNATGSVSNAGSIAAAAGYRGAGVELNRGGSVTNIQTGYVEGSRFGVVVYHAAGTVTNLGTIVTRGTYGLYGVGLRHGGTVVNGATGTTVSSATIYGGSAGVILYGAAGTVTNYGTITGNAGGVILVSGGTVIDAGLISAGGTGSAIYFGAPNALLVLENGYAINGVITATGTGNVVELQGTAGDAVTANYNNLSLISVGTIAFAPGAGNYATLGISNTAALPGTIAGFIGPHDIIDLTTLSDAGNDARVSFDAGADQLMVTAGTATVTLQLDSEDYTGINWVAQNDGSGGTMIMPGTRPPSISGTRANQGVPNQTASTPFSAVSVTDPTTGATDTATVTLSAAANGAFSNLSGGSYNAATGVYSITGTAVAITAALDALVFTPMAQANVYVTTTTFSLSVQGIGGSASDNKTSVTSVQQILSLASVPLSQIAISVSPDGSGFAAAQGGKTNEAVVSAPTSGASYVVPAGFQALFLGGSANATLKDASVGNALLVANQGNDVLIANAANDVLVGGSGTDTLAGGAFASTVVGGSGAATVFAGTGVMQVFGGSGSLVFGGGVNGGSTVAGGSGVATLFGGSGGGNLLFGGTGQATIVGGGSGDMLLAAGTTGDRLYAGSGSETLSGSGAGGSDLLVAGSGNTMMFAGTGADSIVGGSGMSTVSGSVGSPTVFAGSGTMLVYGGSGALVFGGGANAGSTVVGGTGVATLFGGTGGNSLLFGGLGATTMVGGGSGDRLISEGSAGNRIFAGAGNETLAGSNSGGNDLLVAGSGNDVVFAGNGTDTIVAGSGNSQFVADGAPALFVFGNGQAGGSDIIWNFAQGRDHVLLANYGPSAVPSALAGAVSAGGSTTITLSDNTRITFGGIAQLTAHDFA